MDFLLGCIVTGSIAYALYHFRGTAPEKTAESFLSQLEQRIRTMMSDEFNAAVQKLTQAAETKGAQGNQAAVDAAVAAKDAEATAALNDAANNLATTQ